MVHQLSRWLTHDRICLSIDFADCAISEYMFQNYSETQNRICEPLTVCDSTQFISVNATIDSDLICSNLTECDFTLQYIRILATDYTDRKCSALRECSGFEFISVNETTTSNRVCTPLSKCSVTEYAAPQNTTYFDRVCSTCEADGLTADGETCLGCMTEGNCEYNQFALVQDDASCFAEQCTTYSLDGMTFTNASGTFDMEEIVLINDDWVRFDVIDGVEPDITVTGDVVKVYNDLNELLYLYFQVPVSVEDFNATLNDTNFLLRQNCVVTILLEDKCVSDPLVDLCDSNYTRPGQQAIWWEIQYPPLEGGEACPGSGILSIRITLTVSTMIAIGTVTKRAQMTGAAVLIMTGSCGMRRRRKPEQNTVKYIHPVNIMGFRAPQTNVNLCIGPIVAPFCDCKENVIDEDGICGGSGCPLGTFRDLCGICNGTNDCSEEVKLLNEEREAVSSILSWALILAAVVLSGAFIYWVGYCCCSCAKMQWRFRENARLIYERYVRKTEEGIKPEKWEKDIAEQYTRDFKSHQKNV